MSGVVGIIPARAGFTVAELPDAAIVRDHPRSRGVYMLWRPSARSRTGSSPLTRGLQVRTTTMSHSARIIPARAGFTRPPRRSCDHAQDHPRSRGVYPMTPRAGGTLAGSSPLARGLHQHPPHGQAARGIIPARAGFTASASTCARTTRDHPRSRGVYAATRPTRPTCSGSSPLARGLPGRLHPAGGQRRIIPARAGFTVRSRLPVSSSKDHPRSRGVYTEGE